MVALPRILHARRCLKGAVAGLALTSLLVAGAVPVVPAEAEMPSPFAPLAGRWVGEGRLGMREGKTESVKCRATYFVEGDGDQLRQAVRCASTSGSIEITSSVTHHAGALTGTWHELTRNMGGELSGSVNANGFKVAVKGSDLSANMDIIVKGNRQIIEIQFNSTALIGLTLILTKSDQARDQGQPEPVRL